jgi:hypothetical protein
VIDISACSPATLEINPLPEPLVLNRSPTEDNKVHVDFETKFKPLFVSSMPNECPVTMFQLFTSRGEEHRSKYIQLIKSQLDDKWRLDVQNDVANSHTVRVKGWIQTTSIYTHINVRICGQERIKLTDTSAQRKYAIPFIPTDDASQLNDTYRYFRIQEEEFRSFFKVLPEDDPCYVD